MVGFNKEEDREELRSDESVLVLAQKLKEDSFALKKLAVTDSYSNLVMKLKEFCDTHSRDLDELHTYVMGWARRTGLRLGFCSVTECGAQLG